MPVTTFSADEVATVEATDDLWAVARRLSEAEVGALAVMDGGRLHGMVSERDVVHALAAGRDPGDTTAGEVAQTALVWCDVEATVAEVAEEMMEHYVRHVLVEEDGKLVGIASARDLLGAYAAASGSDDAD